jgi:uncharacterized protein YbjT (DUF2867 family)
MKIAVAGGTGCVGKYVVESVEAHGATPVVLARSRGVDLVTGKGLGDALQGVTAVIDVSNVSALTAKKATAFFETATRNLLTAGERAGVAHHVALSIVGCDRVDMGYYRSKLRQEELVLTGPVPGSVLRATQFHEFAAQVIAYRGPIAFSVKSLNQPIAAREVAEALVDMAVSAPVGLGPELAGPEPHEMTDLIRRLLHARGSRRLVVSFPMPGRAGKAMAGGGLLPTSPGPRGTQTFDEWLSTDALAGRPNPQPSNR